MTRPVLACCLVLLCGTAALAEPPPPIQLTLTPAKPPTPALRYQLLADARVTISGDAAPIYKEVTALLAKKLHRQNAPLFDAWYQMPVDQLPKDAARKLLADYEDVYALLDKAARCDHCDWGLLDRLREKGIGALLPEIQPMRECAQLLAVRARFEIAEGRHDKAVVTLRNGFALARHTGESHTLISFLVGVAIANIMEGQLDVLVGRADAPNLYYALTDLPAPLISMRRAIQGERVMAYGTFPGLFAVAADLDAGNMTEKELADAVKLLQGLNDKEINYYVDRFRLGRNILSKHEAAKKALVAAGRPREKVEAMPHLQVALLHALLEYDAALDDMIVWHNLPYWEQRERLADLDKRVRANRRDDADAPAVGLAPLLLPAVNKVTFARARNDRKVALLRTVEAVRYYAAEHDGKLPPYLGAIKEVSVPTDPVTGKAFGYRLERDVAKLTAPPPDKETPNAANTVVYELRIRK
jgi:hypothetical protein